jgi:polyisoprenoid-binding protein YceI
MSRTARNWLVAMVAAAAVIVVGGPFVYIHFVEGKPPAKLAIASGGQVRSPVASGGSVDGTWNVAPGSQAGYRVNEVLFGQDNTAVGRTTHVSGSMTVGSASVQRAAFTVDLTSVTSDQSRRDGQFQHRIMDTSTYPTATFALGSPIALPASITDGQAVTVTASGALTLHGTTKQVSFTVQAKRAGSTIEVSGSIPVTFADYGIPNPGFGPVTTDDHGTIEFLIDFVHG